jgi:hypothetical protein
VFLGELVGDPDDRDSLQTCGVGQELAEVSMVSAFQLILDQDPVPSGRVFA